MQYKDETNSNAITPANGDSKSLLPIQPSPKSSQPKVSASKPGKAKEAIADVVSRRDATVASLLEDAQAVANRETESRRKVLAERLGMQMAESELQALEEVADFLSSTLGSSQWLLEGVRDTIEVEVIA